MNTATTPRRVIRIVPSAALLAAHQMRRNLAGTTPVVTREPGPAPTVTTPTFGHTRNYHYSR